MTLIVDFNRVDKAGLVPARIPPAQVQEFHPGLEVVLSDGEGTSCLATVVDVTPTGVAHLLPMKGTFRREPVTA